MQGRKWSIESRVIHGAAIEPNQRLARGVVQAKWARNPQSRQQLKQIEFASQALAV
jgi:hypothetical protein